MIDEQMVDKQYLLCGLRSFGGESFGGEMSADQVAPTTVIFSSFSLSNDRRQTHDVRKKPLDT